MEWLVVVGSLYITVVRWKRVLSPEKSLKTGFPGGSDGKESACNAGDSGLIPRLGRSPETGEGYPL